jgi:hypothetical protein
MCFLAIWTSSFEKILFSSVAHFFIGSVILGEFSSLSSLGGYCEDQFEANPDKKIVKTTPISTSKPGMV